MKNILNTIWKWLGFEDKNRPPNIKRHKDWARVRDAWLKAHPECAVCKSKENVVVHHIDPVQHAPEKELVETNFLTLCEGPPVNCHLFVGHLMNWASWNPLAQIHAAMWRYRIANRATPRLCSTQQKSEILLMPEKKEPPPCRICNGMGTVHVRSKIGSPPSVRQTCPACGGRA